MSQPPETDFRKPRASGWCLASSPKVRQCPSLDLSASLPKGMDFRKDFPLPSSPSESMPAAQSAHPGGPETSRQNANTPEMSVFWKSSVSRTFSTPLLPPLGAFTLSRVIERTDYTRQGPSPGPDTERPGVPGAPQSVGVGTGGLPRAPRRAVGPSGEGPPPGGSG